MLEFFFDFCAGKHVVLGLFHDGANQTELVCYPPCSGNLVGIPFRSSPIKRFARIDDMVESSDCLFNGSIAVRSVSIDQVDVFQLQTLEGRINTLNDVFTREAKIVDWIFSKGTSPIYLVNVSYVLGAWAKEMCTFVDMTRSLRFQPYFLIACPIIFSDSPLL